MVAQTALAPAHLAAGARLTEFAGWQLPVSFASTQVEHGAVRTQAGLFDVSHMLTTDVSGPDAEAALRRLLCGDVRRLATPGAGMYSGLLNEHGGVIDDLIVFRRAIGEGFRVVSNAGTRPRVSACFEAATSADVAFAPRADLSMIAVQGPQAIARAGAALERVLGEQAADLADLTALRRFHAREGTGDGARDVFVSRTGYTGEDGVEVLLPHAQALRLWDALVADGVTPCGLAVRDVLRLEAGMRLHGTDMDEQTRPGEVGLGNIVDLRDASREFTGRHAVDPNSDGYQPERFRFAALALTEKGIPRTGCQVLDASSGAEVGVVTSGSFSLSCDSGIALVRLHSTFPQPADPTAAPPLLVQVRKKQLGARLVALPFHRRGARAGAPAA